MQAQPLLIPALEHDWSPPLRVTRGRRNARLRILYLIPHVPNPRKSRGYHQLMGLLNAGNEVTIATLRRTTEDDDNILRLRAMGFHVIWAPLNRKLAAVNGVGGWLLGRPLQAKLLWSRSLWQQIQQTLRENPPDVVHVEHLRMADYGLRLEREWPVVWDAVDNLSLLYSQARADSVSRAWQFLGYVETPRLRGYERKLAERFLTTLVVSPRDQAQFQENSRAAGRVQIAPLGVRTLARASVDSGRAANTLVITGNLNYHPNVAAVHYFVEHVFPLILRKRPEVRLQLVGANPVPSIVALENEHITVTGYVDSVTEYLERATVALAPITYGAGIQTKVIEALFVGTPVVATSKAVCGLGVKPNEHVLVADTAEDFADAVVRLLDDPELRRALSCAGRDYVSRHHDLTQTTENLIQIYRNVIDRKQRESRVVAYGFAPSV